MIVWKHALLTGATGALGPAMAAELLAANPSGTLAVLIRAANEPAINRYNEWLGYVGEILSQRGMSSSFWRDRVIPVEGDVRSDGLGIESPLQRQLQQKTDLVIHAAADTGFRSAAQDQWDINVEGTRRAVQWTRGCRKSARFMMVSTVCTSGVRTGLIEEAFTPTPPQFVNNYERTKWEAEKLTVESGLEHALARVSIVMGSHETGAVYRMGAMHQLFKWFARGMVPVLQGKPDSPMDLICTETAATFIAKAAQTKWESDSVWHVAAGERAGTLMDLAVVGFRELQGRSVVENTEQPGEPYLVDRETYERVQSESTPRQRAMRQAMDSLSSFVPMLLHSRTYETTRAHKLWGGPLPMPDWKLTVSRVINYLGMTYSPEREVEAA